MLFLLPTVGTRRFLSALMLVVLACLGSLFGVQTSDAGEIDSRSDTREGLEHRLRAEIRVVLMDMIQSGELSAESDSPIALTIDSKAERAADLGIIVDTRNGAAASAGLRILGTTPGALANKIGLRNGDLIVAVNGEPLSALGDSEDGSAQAGPVLRDALASLEEGSRLSFDIFRENRRMEVSGTMHFLHIPAFSLRVGGIDGTAQAVANVDSPTHAGKSCGWITTFDNAPRQQQLHASILISIDGVSTPLRGRGSYQLATGKHLLKVGELIEDRYLGFGHAFRDRGTGDRYKTLEVEVRPDTAYSLAARLNVDRRNEWREGKFWDPVIWSTKAERCR